LGIWEYINIKKIPNKPSCINKMSRASLKIKDVHSQKENKKRKRKTKAPSKHQGFAAASAPPVVTTPPGM
jgi:hypothetical protein